MNVRMTISAALLAAWSSCGMAANTDAAPPSVLVTVTRLHQGSLPRTITAYGAVQSTPSARLSLSAKRAGTIGQIYVHVGDQVPPDSPLMQLVPDAQTIAAYQQAEAAQRAARRQVSRTHKLLSQHLATTQDLENADKAEADATATLAALNAQGGDKPSILHAPYPAIVMRLPLVAGNAVTPGTVLAELTKADGLILRVGVMPDEARRIHAGDAAQITSIDGSDPTPATVVRRGSVVEPASGLVSVDVALLKGALFPGESANAIITVGEATGYLVPHAAVLVDDQGNPYVVQADGTKAHKVPVQVVASHGDTDAIQGPGLDPKQALVLSGNYQIDDGMHVRFADASKESAK